MAIGYSYSGYTKLVSPSWVDGSAIARILDSPLARPSFVRDLALALPTPVLQLMTWGGLALELLFAPLALVRRVRPWLWLAMLGLHLNLMVLIDFADLSFGMVILHAFTFDPSWLRARRSAGEWVVYYDGSCGLCHRTVRLLLAEDRGAVFRYAPLESARFANEVAPSEAGEPPDSIVLRTPDGELRVRSAALIEIGDQLGGIWRALALASRAVPRVLRDSTLRPDRGHSPAPISQAGTGPPDRASGPARALLALTPDSPPRTTLGNSDARVRGLAPGTWYR